jgi:hypothetical protein
MGYAYERCAAESRSDEAACRWRVITAAGLRTAKPR